MSRDFPQVYLFQRSLYTKKRGRDRSLPLRDSVTRRNSTNNRFVSDYLTISEAALSCALTSKSNLSDTSFLEAALRIEDLPWSARSRSICMNEAWLKRIGAERSTFDTVDTADTSPRLSSKPSVGAVSISPWWSGSFSKISSYINSPQAPLHPDLHSRSPKDLLPAEYNDRA